MTARTIATAAELDALPVGSVVRNLSRGITAERLADGRGVIPGNPAACPWDSLWSAGSHIVVLHDPSAPAPVWDEGTVTNKALARARAALLQTSPLQATPWVARLLDEVVEATLAVVREHLPVRPERETIARAIHSAHRPTTGPTPAWDAEAPAWRQTYLDFADAVLDLWPGESRATVQAEALHAAATQLIAEDNNRGDWWDDEANEYCTPAEWLRARADRARTDR